MLPPFIIEQIRKREEESKRGVQDQPQLEIPRDVPRPRPAAEPKEEEGERGVVIVQL